MGESFPEALTSLNQALSLDANNSWTLTCRGQTYRQLARYEEALADFDRAISLDAKDDWCLYE